MKLHVIYRLCDRVHSEHGVPRPFNFKNKIDLIKVCQKSLAASVNQLEHYTSVVGDNVSEDLWNFTLQTLKPANTFNFDTPKGNAQSLLKASEFAVATDVNDLVYMVEDDYLHDPQFFAQRLVDFVQSTNNIKFALPVFLHPTDYPDQYKTLKRSYIFGGQTGYFREVSSTTLTLFTQSKNYRKFASFFNQCYSDNANDGLLSTIFKKDALCFSPLPGIATHMHEGVMSGYVDWNKILLKFIDN